MTSEPRSRSERMGRQRDPAPLIRRRIPSGSPSMLQPNVTHDGETRLTPWFWLMIALTGVFTGLMAIALMKLLFSVQHWAYGTAEDGTGFLNSLDAADGWHRVFPLLVAGVIAGPGWYFLRKYTPGAKSELDEVLWTGHGRLSFRRSAGTSVLSEIVVGLGASLGREAAPKLMGAVAGNLIGEWSRLTDHQKRLLVACGGGAGFAAVYNVPLGGALFTAEVLIGSTTLPVVLPALGCAGVATLTAWLWLPHHATYVTIPDYPYDIRLLVWAILFAPLFSVMSVGYVRLIAWVSHHRAPGRWMLVAPLGAFSILALIGLRYPQLYGNGKDIAHFAFEGTGLLWLFGALFMLKPLVTALCLGSGATGGMFTPVMSTGAAAGAFFGIAYSHLWPGSAVGAYAMIGASAMIGAAMQAPLAALLLVLELTHSGFGIMVPMVFATVIATAMSRWIDGYSIYSARISALTPLDM